MITSDVIAMDYYSVTVEGVPVIGTGNVLTVTKRTRKSGEQTLKKCIGADNIGTPLT